MDAGEASHNLFPMKDTDDLFLDLINSLFDELLKKTTNNCGIGIIEEVPD